MFGIAHVLINVVRWISCTLCFYAVPTNALCITGHTIPIQPACKWHLPWQTSFLHTFRPNKTRQNCASRSHLTSQMRSLNAYCRLHGSCAAKSPTFFRCSCRHDLLAQALPTQVKKSSAWIAAVLHNIDSMLLIVWAKACSMDQHQRLHACGLESCDCHFSSSVSYQESQD